MAKNCGSCGREQLTKWESINTHLLAHHDPAVPTDMKALDSRDHETRRGLNQPYNAYSRKKVTTVKLQC